MTSILYAKNPAFVGRSRATNTLLRRLAIAKLRELRRTGMSYRDVVRYFGNKEARDPDEPRSRFRLPPERLLQAPLNSADADVLPRALDTLEQGLAFFSASLSLVYANRALLRVLDTDLGGAALRQEIQLFAISLWCLVEVRAWGQEEIAEQVAAWATADASHRLQASYYGIDLFGCGPSVLVSLEVPTSDPLSDQVLHQRFGLSKQQARITRFLVQGQSNTEIADRLSISPHTARHHTERILQKLGIHSRAEVPSRVLWDGLSKR